MTLEVVDEAFRKGVADVSTAATLLAAATVDATRLCDQLMSGWTGSAADSMSAAYDEWRRAAQQCRTQLELMAEQLLAFHRDLGAQDNASERTLEQIVARLAGTPR